MRNILMSIKPLYSQAILRGEKTVEFRRVFSNAASATGRVIIYESAPTMKIVGSFEIERIDQPLTGKFHNDRANEIWENMERTPSALPGIEYEPFRDYVLGAKSPCAIYVKDVVKLEKPFSPKGIDPIFRPPQSYMWCPEWLEYRFLREIDRQTHGSFGRFSPNGDIRTLAK